MISSTEQPVLDVAVADPGETGWPVTLGVPFAQGVLPAASVLGLCDPDGEPRPLSVRTLVAWPDGSVRWALLAFGAQQTGPHMVTTGTAITALPHPVRLDQKSDGIALDNGLVSVRLSTSGPGPIHELIAHGKLILNDPSNFELRVDDASTSGESLRQLRVLEDSPQRARVRVEGAHFTTDGERRLSYRLDVELWAGWPALRLDYHFFNLEPGAEELQIDQIQIALRPQLAGDLKRHFRQRYHGTFAQPREVTNPGAIAIRADKTRNSPYIEEWAMMLDDTSYPRYLRPLVVDTSAWIGLLGAEQGVYLQMHDFVDMRPKRLVSENDSLILEVWPAAAGPLLLPQGRSRQQTITLAFPESLPVAAGQIEKLLGAPLHEGRACVAAGWLRRCRVFEQDLVLEPNRNVRFEKYLSRLVRLETPRDMFDLGDTIEPSYTSGYLKTGRLPLKPGVAEPANPMRATSTEGIEWAGDERFEPAWSNNEYDAIHALCSEIMRNTRHDLWPTLRHFARHNIEVDFVYYSDDPWQHHGSPAHAAWHNMASAYPSHMWTQGLLEYYCLSGDPDALEVAVKLGDTILRNFQDPERRKTLWGFNREVGWPLLALVCLADLTGEERFWVQLEEFVEYLIAFDRQSNREPVKLSGVNPRHSMDRQIAGSYFGYASMVEGLNLYANLRNHAGLRDWLVDLLMRLKDAMWQAQGAGGGSSFLLLQGMAIGYELTGDQDFLRVGVLGLEQLIDSSAWFSSLPTVKTVAVSYRAYIRFLHHAERAGLLERLEYASLRSVDFQGRTSD
ncbi:MAG TPA: beta-L-arabinofuranosidase domain-containing protein [Abditibacteriaceae bacterium]|nr:beta-L-arabinofuranosidase domain-containing protein [Abditibacteriaceae bacterium]